MSDLVVDGHHQAASEAVLRLGEGAGRLVDQTTVRRTTWEGDVAKATREPPPDVSSIDRPRQPGQGGARIPDKL